jgi:hypothetical protein
MFHEMPIKNRGWVINVKDNRDILSAWKWKILQSRYREIVHRNGNYGGPRTGRKMVAGSSTVGTYGHVSKSVWKQSEDG